MMNFIQKSIPNFFFQSMFFKNPITLSQDSAIQMIAIKNEKFFVLLIDFFAKDKLSDEHTIW